MRILHIMTLEKFTQPFLEFINEQFDSKEHMFIVINKDSDQYTLDRTLDNVMEIKKDNMFINISKFISALYGYEKIIIHGLNSKVVSLLLYLQPWLLKKSYWVMWGGDFYFPEKQSFLKKQVIKKMGNFVTYIKGDYELCKKWYGASGRQHDCFMYPSNLYKDYEVTSKESDIINIQVGNSADPTNNHLAIFEQLKKYKDENINIFVPLSYGNQKNAQEVIAKGKDIFGDKFKPLTGFIPFKKYLDFLGDIDIAIFAHKRQQAMGNIITLLGLGKKVYIRNDITPWELFNDIGVKVYDVETIDLSSFSNDEKEQNKNKIKEYFSKENYLKQLKLLFES